MTDAVPLSTPGFLMRLLLVLLAYTLTGWFGLTLASWGNQVTLIWPPTGIALFALLVWGTRMWPAIWLGAALVNLLMGSSLAGALAIAAGNTAGPVLATLLLRRFGFDHRFVSGRDVLLFVGLGALAGMAVNASVGTATLILDGVLSATVAGPVWLTWWLGDALGVLVVGTALLALANRDSGPGEGRLEAVVAWVGLVAVGTLCLTPLSPMPDGLPPFLTLPFIIWLALRQRAGHAAWGVLFLAGLAVWSVTIPFGPFVSGGGGVEMARLWTFMFIQAIASLLVTTLRGELAHALAETRTHVARLHEAEAIAKLGSWELDLGTGVLAWSPEIYRIFEIDPTRFRPSYEAFLGTIHPDDRDKVNQAYTESVAAKAPYTVVHRLLFPDGRIKHVREHALTEYGEDGTALRSIGTVQDITDLETARQSLLESEAKFRAFADFTYDWEVWVGPDGRFRYVAPACERVTGYSAEEFMAGTCRMLDIVHPDDRAGVADHFCNFSETGCDSTTLEFRIRRKDGGERWIEHVCQAVFTDGRYMGRRASNRDITERKAAEAELTLYRSHLEELVAERTAELARARDQAEAANRAKSVFLSNMSHELRTPLNAVLGFAQLMERDSTLTAEQRGNLVTINRSGRHLLDLINDVLEISRIESGRAAVLNAPFHLDDSLRAIEEMTRVRADAKGLAFTVERAGELPTFVDGDAQRLRQILLNLLSNAVKFTDRGEVRLRVIPAGPDRLRFEVGDTGPGIPAAERERIFQAFYQTALGEARGEGTGLGLPISREYAHLMGGELGLADTPPGQGSTFYCELPLPAVPGTVAEAIIPHHVIRLMPGQRDYDVLVVEDNPDNRELLSRLLGRVGYRVRVAVDGNAALARCQEAMPDFIWMDMRMPGMDGYEATRHIRALPGGGEIRIAALTASAFRENRADILAAGCDDMVAKPLDAGAIFETMARLLGVEYEYEQAAETVPSGARAWLLAPLPAGLAGELRTAAQALDVEAAEALISRLADSDPESAHTLRALLADFRFEEIERLAGN